MSGISRRSFLLSLPAAAAAPAILSARSRTARLPIAFSTLGCPKWEWKTVLRQAADLGYSAIELRGLQGEMDLTKRPELLGSRLKASLEDLAALDLKVSDLGSSAKMHEADPTVRAAQLDEGRRFIDLAHAMGVPYVRVFGDKLPPGEPRAATVERIVAGLRTLGERARGRRSHRDPRVSRRLHELGLAPRASGGGLHALGRPALGRAPYGGGGQGDAGLHLREARRFVRHTHLKDSRPEGGERRYVLTGTGDVPVKETVRVLAAAGYKGYYCFEWEKAWHPEIEEPEVAFPHYARTIREYLAETGPRGA